MVLVCGRDCEQRKKFSRYRHFASGLRNENWINVSGVHLRIIYRDEHLVVVDKPAGFHVHPPEDTAHKISKNQNCLYLLGKQLNAYLYPVHRLDRATSGVLIFALSSEAASGLAAQFKKREVKKTYYCVVRGWIAERGSVDRPLEPMKDALTHFEKLATLEIAEPVGKFATARYSLVKVEPVTGRMHQIRKHLSGISYPLLGDSVYGDGRHNRFFREKFGISGLFLKASALDFVHPITGKRHLIHSRWGGAWHRVFDLFGVCPF